MLTRYEPGGRRHDMLLDEVIKNERMLKNASSDLANQRADLENCQQDISESQTSIARYKAILSGEEDDGSESRRDHLRSRRRPMPPDIAGGGVASTDRNLEFVLKSNGWYHPAGSSGEQLLLLRSDTVGIRAAPS